MLTVDNLSKSFGKKTVLDNISVQLTHGVYGLLGPNGSGKTTFMRCVAGIYRYNGRIITPSNVGYLAFIFQGQPILRHFRLSRRICPQNFQIGTPCLWFFHRLCLACCLGICWTDFGINTYDGQDTGMCILWRFGQSPSTIIRCRLVRYSVFSAIVRLIFSWSPLEHPLLYYRASK